MYQLSYLLDFLLSFALVEKDKQGQVLQSNMETEGPKGQVLQSNTHPTDIPAWQGS